MLWFPSLWEPGFWTAFYFPPVAAISMAFSGLKAQVWHLLLSLQVAHTSPGFISAILTLRSLMRVSRVEVIGFLKNHASLLRLQLFSYESSGVYAIGSHLLSWSEKKGSQLMPTAPCWGLWWILPPIESPYLRTHLPSVGWFGSCYLKWEIFREDSCISVHLSSFEFISVHVWQSSV